MRLSEDIQRLLQDDPDKGRGGITVGTLLERVGDKGFGLLLVVLSLPSALPVPAPGYSIPFGILLFLIGLQMAVGRPNPTLPRRVRRFAIKRELAHKLLAAAAVFFRKLEFLVRPRLRWIGSRVGHAVLSGLVLFMALLMAIPIPWTNTLPALVIFLIGIGLTEEDGLFTLFACLVGLLVIALYASATYFLIVFFKEFGWGAFAHFFDLLKDWLRGFFPASGAA